MLGTIATIDILGFSNLTDFGKNELEKLSFINKIILRFHEIIRNELQIYRGVRYQVISDSVVIWTPGASVDAIKITSMIVRRSLKSGFLVRAAITYGNFEETKSVLAGRLLFGKAVTHAVHLEKSGKGARVFCDSDIQMQITTTDATTAILFSEYRNYSNYSYVDIVNWPFVLGTRVVESSSEKNGIVNRVLRENIALVSELVYTDTYKWISDSKEGLEHLIATIEYLSDKINCLIRVSSPASDFEYGHSRSGLESIQLNTRHISEVNIPLIVEKTMKYIKFGSNYME